MAVDIAQELAVIHSQAGGETVKSAIASALTKVAAVRGETIKEEFVAGQGYDDTDGALDVCIASIAEFDYDAAQNVLTDDGRANTRTVSLTVTANSLLLAAVMHRAGANLVDISDDGWTKLVTTENQATGGSGENDNQYISVWGKQVTPGDYSATVTYQGGRTYQLNLKMIALHGMTSTTKIDDVMITSFPFIPSAKTVNRRLYLLSNIRAYSDQTQTMIFDITGEAVMDSICPQSRFVVFFDNTTEAVDARFTYDSGGYYANTANCITLDVT
jgi:hypothetical protein